MKDIKMDESNPWSRGNGRLAAERVDIQTRNTAGDIYTAIIYENMSIVTQIVRQVHVFLQRLAYLT